MTLKDRVKEFITYLKVETKTFEQKCSLSNGFVNNIGHSIREKSINQILEQYPELNKIWLLTGEGQMLTTKINQSQNNAKPLHELQYPIEPGESPFIDMGNGQLTMLIPLVDEYSYGSFPGGFRDPEYVSDLRKISITVDKRHSGKYFAFEILGESMENYEDKESAKKSIPEGSIVVGREIQRHHWKSRLHYHKWATFVIVHREYGIACKTILDQDVEDGIIRLGSFNPDKVKHKDFTWHLDDVQAIYNVVRIINEM
jgi:phage repressor protein C with HTH and peptisase S24 domain